MPPDEAAFFISTANLYKSDRLGYNNGELFHN